MPTELHLRAARHHEAAGDHREAIDHALAARDFDDAGRLIERAAPRLWTSGEAQSVQAWLAALPDAVLWRKAGLVLDSTLRFLESLSWTTEANYARGMTLVEPLLGRLRALMRDSPADAGAVEARACACSAACWRRAVCCGTAIRGGWRRSSMSWRAWPGRSPSAGGRRGVRGGRSASRAVRCVGGRGP